MICSLSIAISKNKRSTVQMMLTWSLRPSHFGKWCEVLTVREPHKAFSTKLRETECGSRNRKEAVANLIASGMVTSKGIGEESNGKRRNEALKFGNKPRVKTIDQMGAGP
jgi:hypothetical protein